MITRHHSNTNIKYVFEGTPVSDKYWKQPYKVTIETWQTDELAKVVKTGQFVYRVPEMWEKSAKIGGYDIVCKVEKIEKVTEVTTWTHEDITLEDLAR